MIRYIRWYVTMVGRFVARMCYTWTREDYSNGYTTRRSSSCFVDGKLEGRVKTTCYRDEGSLDLFLFLLQK